MLGLREELPRLDRPRPQRWQRHLIVKEAHHLLERQLRLNKFWMASKGTEHDALRLLLNSLPSFEGHLLHQLHPHPTIMIIPSPFYPCGLLGVSKRS